MMEDMASYPTIEPTNFDLIVVGTGLPESILAAAASAAGKSVLHLDPSPSYGSHFASLSLQEFSTFLHTHSHSQSPAPPAEIQPNSSSEFNTVPLLTRPLYSSVEICSHSTEVHEMSRKFSLDLVGPRVLFCADAMIDLILKTDINQYMEFKSVDGSFVCDGEGCLRNVPDSRSAIFKDKSLSFSEKNQLMRFFKLVQGHFENEGGEESKRISEEDLETPFVEFLSQKIGLSKKLKSYPSGSWQRGLTIEDKELLIRYASEYFNLPHIRVGPYDSNIVTGFLPEIILYAIAMADYDQENREVCKDVLKTKDGIDCLILYHSSVGRFPNAPGAMIYPMYGQGELPQAFCRRAAVKGCIYVLRMPVVGLLIDKMQDVLSYRGVKLVSGQELFGHHLILAPSFVLPSESTHISPCHQQDGSCDSGVPGAKEMVARGICITKNSLKPDVFNCLVFYPPQSLCPEQLTSVHVFQLSSNVAVCPSGMFVIYLSAICDDVLQGKNILNAAINALFSLPTSTETEKSSAEHQNENSVVKERPALLWSAVYMQELTMGMSNGYYSTPMPDADLQYNNLLDATRRLFQVMYPSEEFFPKSASHGEAADDGASELEYENSENLPAVDEEAPLS